MDRMQAPPRNAFLGLMSDLASGTVGYMQDPRRTQQMQALGQTIESTRIPSLLESLSYGDSPFEGSGMTTRPNADVRGLIELAAAASPAGRPAAAAVNRGAMALGRAGERVGMAAEKALEAPLQRAYDKGGLSREMLLAMAQGTQSKMFIGPKSKAWDKASAEVAQKMEKDGSPARNIWERTGTFKGLDGKWRQEISDQDINFRTQSFGKDRQGNKVVFPVSEGSASQVFEHPELYNAYPFTKKINTEIGKRPKTSGSAEYGVEGRFIEAYGPSDDEVKSALVHEMQHQIQDREGMSAGSNFIAGNENDFQRYLRAAGEAEARATQARRNMSMDQRRSLFPMDSYDVPLDELNVDSQKVRSLLQSLGR